MNSLSITWSPPSFYSDDIPQWSVTTYHVIVQNNNGSILVNINATDTFYNKFSNKVTICDIYTITVTAFIEQYTSIDVSSIREYSGNKLTTSLNKPIMLHQRLYSCNTKLYLLTLKKL